MVWKYLSEYGREFDMSDPKLAHPEVAEPWIMGSPEPNMTLIDPNVPLERKREIEKELYAQTVAALAPMAADPSLIEIKEYDVPGCPEEPETKAHVWVYTPRHLKGKRNKVLFCLGPGSLLSTVRPMFDLRALKYDCIVVSCDYRTALYGGYPHTINDIHAAFAWMVENAQELRIDPDKVVLYGMSSGAHLALASTFRLMRYGFKNIRGIVADGPMVDDRSFHTSVQSTAFGGWDGHLSWRASKMWLGENAGSPFLGPEAFANRATVEECVGYPPCFIHTSEFDPQIDACSEFVRKLRKNHTYCDFHEWGGVMHATFFANPFADYSKRFESILDGNIMDCFKYDLRRSWLGEE